MLLFIPGVSNYNLRLYLYFGVSTYVLSRAFLRNVFDHTRIARRIIVTLHNWAEAGDYESSFYCMLVVFELDAGQGACSPLSAYMCPIILVQHIAVVPCERNAKHGSIFKLKTRLPLYTI